ncbi:MAG: efflux RND transporter periplasmic adaptor subunit [Clostridiales bacterium]|jgi:HlyD family secretion protein|nr:efflux RND transporter periplasmic adaptor subunit [Clostridiales bacterium]
MKTFVKILLLVIIAGGGGAYAYYVSIQPLSVPAIVLQPREAALYFTEKGVVGYRDDVNVYPLLSGKTAELYVAEDEPVEAGASFCRIDVSDLDFDLAQAQAQISSLTAQKNDLDLARAREADSLILQKNGLLKEIATIDAQASDDSLAKESQERLTEEQARLKEEQARLQAIILEQNEADIARASRDAEKLQVLYDSGAIPLSDLEAAQEILKGYEQQYIRSQQQLKVIEAGPLASLQQTRDEYFSAARAALEEQIIGIDESLTKDYTTEMKAYFDAQITSVRHTIDRLNKTKGDAMVYAPESGIVTELMVSLGQTVSAAAPVAVISTGQPLIAVYVATNDINSVEVGKEVEIILKRRAGDEVYKGRVFEVEDEAQVRVSTLGVEERKVRVFVEPLESPEFFKIGYDADVRFLVYKQEDVLVLPKTALFKEDETERVWEIADGVLKKTEIVKGMELSNDVVVQGLAPGSVVAGDANDKELAEGVKAVGVVE